MPEPERRDDSMGGIEESGWTAAGLPAFDFPFPVRFSPDVARARVDNVSRMKAHGMLITPEAEQWYLSWDMAQLAGYSYPLAVGDDLDLAVDLMTFFFVFDDQFDGPLGREPAAAAAFTAELIAVLHRPPGQPLPRSCSPLVSFFADFWDRSKRGMPPWWAARASCNWEYYLGTHVPEAIDRINGRIPSWDHYLHVRRGMCGTVSVVDYCEWTGRFITPQAIAHTPQYRMMHRIATDVPMFCNDVHSVHKEAPRGDVHNAVLVVEHERGCTRAEALRTVRDMVMIDRIPHFQRLEPELMRTCATLDLDDRDRAAVDKAVAAFKAWMVGYHQWEIETARYRPESLVPPDRPNYVEDLVNRSE